MPLKIRHHEIAHMLDPLRERIAALKAEQIVLENALEVVELHQFQAKKRAEAAEAREKQACVDRHELLAERDRLREALEEIVDRADMPGSCDRCFHLRYIAQAPLADKG